MRVFGLWFGGSSYSAPLPDQREEFASIKEAKTVMWRRLDNFDRSTPCVTDDSEMLLYRCDPATVEDPYPDVRLSFGPRGAVKQERC